jgi:hypothetical protein
MIPPSKFYVLFIRNVPFFMSYLSKRCHYLRQVREIRTLDIEDSLRDRQGTSANHGLLVLWGFNAMEGGKTTKPNPKHMELR